jgi:lipopolysaccharide export system protein LptA
VIIAALAALIGAKQPSRAPRSYRVTARSIEVTTGATVTHLHASGGVTVVGSKGETIKAASADFDLKRMPAKPQAGPKKAGARQSAQGEAIPEKYESAKQSLSVYKVSFKRENIRNIVLTGGATYRTATDSIAASRLASADGGKVWHATGRVRVESRRKGANGAGAFTCTSDRADFNTETRAASASGNVQITDTSGSDTVHAHAGKAEYDPKSDIVTLTEAPRVEYQDVRLEANKITVERAGARMVATGNPAITKGASMMTGKCIVVTRKGGKFVVDVQGQKETTFSCATGMRPDGRSPASG